MLTSRQAVDNATIAQLARALSGSHAVPPYILEADPDRRIVAALKSEGGFVGVAYGLLLPNGKSFRLCNFFILKEHRSAASITQLLEAVLLPAKAAKADRAIWRSNIGLNGRDVRPQLLAKLPFCRVEGAHDTTAYTIEASGFGQIIGYNKCKKQSLAGMGYRMVKWADCGDALKTEIRRREAGTPPDYLSPFIEEEVGWYGKLDGRTSFVLAKGGAPVGWLICEQVGEKGVRVLRFYVYPERRTPTAITFLVHVMEEMRHCYERLHFEVVEENLRMSRFVHNICRAVLEKERITRGLTLALG